LKLNYISQYGEIFQIKVIKRVNTKLVKIINKINCLTKAIKIKKKKLKKSHSVILFILDNCKLMNRKTNLSVEEIIKGL